MAEKLLVMCALDPIEKNAEFEDDLPTHVTITPWFQLEPKHRQNVISRMPGLLQRRQPFLISGGEKKMFGPRNDIPVRVLKKIGSTSLIHAELNEIVKAHGSYLNENYIGEAYTPHVSYTENGGLEEGEVRLISHAQLVKKVDDQPKVILRNFQFPKVKRW